MSQIAFSKISTEVNDCKGAKKSLLLERESYKTFLKTEELKTAYHIN